MTMAKCFGICLNFAIVKYFLQSFARQNFGKNARAFARCGICNRYHLDLFKYLKLNGNICDIWTRVLPLVRAPVSDWPSRPFANCRQTELDHHRGPSEPKHLRICWSNIVAKSSTWQWLNRREPKVWPIRRWQALSLPSQKKPSLLFAS